MSKLKCPLCNGIIKEEEVFMGHYNEPNFIIYKCKGCGFSTRDKDELLKTKPDKTYDENIKNMIQGYYGEQTPKLCTPKSTKIKDNYIDNIKNMIKGYFHGRC